MDEATVTTWLDNDYYEVLGVDSDAERAEIVKAYRRQARAHHPDTAGDGVDPAAFRQAQDAFDVLGHDEVRAQYDEVRRVAQHLIMLAERRAEIDEADAWIPACSSRLRMQAQFNPMAAMANPWNPFMPWSMWASVSRG